MRIFSTKHMAGAYQLFAVICVVLSSLALTSEARSVFLTPLDKTSSEVKVCPEANCPAMPQHPFREGTRVVIFETKNGWARGTKFIEREQIAAQFPGKFLPNQVAMWISVQDLPEITSTSPEIKDAIADEEAQEAKKLAEEEKKKKARQFSFVPKRPAIPTPRSDRVEVAALETLKPETPATSETEEVVETETELTVATESEVETEQQVKDQEKSEETELSEATKEDSDQETQAVADEQNTTPVTEPVTEAQNTQTATEGEIEVAAVELEATETAEPAPDTPIPTKAEREEVKEPEVTNEDDTQPVAEVETAKLEEPKLEEENAEVTESEAETTVEEEVETDSFGNPIVSAPKKLTKELRDKRLSKLPSKPGRGYDLKAIIAMRHHGLELLKNNECSGIAEGGRSLSLEGWIYLRCENDPTFRQFSIE